MKSRLALLFLLLLAPHFVQADGSYFMTVKLPRGVEIDLPKDWGVLTSEQNSLIAMSSEAALEVSGIGTQEGTEVNLIAVVSKVKSAYASVRVDSTTPAVEQPFEITALTYADLKAYESEVESISRTLLSTKDNELIQFFGVQRVTVSGYPGFITEYSRSSKTGPVIVRIVQIFTPNQTIRISMSFDENKDLIWKPVMEKVFKSIVVRKWP